jgi:hypothetical protein
VLVLIGPRWLPVASALRPRLFDRDDIVRWEIDLAMHADALVIPVLVGGAQMPAARELPPSITGLAKLDAVEIRDARWHDDASRLCCYMVAALERIKRRQFKTMADATDAGTAAIGEVGLGLLLARRDEAQSASVLRGVVENAQGLRGAGAQMEAARSAAFFLFDLGDRRGERKLANFGLDSWWDLSLRESGGLDAMLAQIPFPARKTILRKVARKALSGAWD